MWFGSLRLGGCGKARLGEARRGTARKGGRGEVSQGVFSSGELWLVEAVEAGRGKFWWGRVRSGVEWRLWNVTVRRVTASCGGLGSVWQCKVGSGAARFGKTVGVRLGKVGIAWHDMFWLGGLGQARQGYVGFGAARRSWYGKAS